MKAIQPYLLFNGNGKQAMEFYAKCLNTELQASTFGESPTPCPEHSKSRMIHGRIEKGSCVLMASDCMEGMEHSQGNNFSVTIDCDSIEEIEKLFAAFGVKAKITLPVQETFWAKRFGMLTDQFGVHWMFNLDK